MAIRSEHELLVETGQAECISWKQMILSAVSFFSFIVLTCIRIQWIKSNGFNYFLKSKPLLHRTRNYLSGGKMDASPRKRLGEGGCCLCAAGCHMIMAVARQPCLGYGPEIMSVKKRVKGCTHAQIFCTLKRRLGLAERSCYSIRTWTSANGIGGRREDIIRVGTQLSVCAPLHYLWSLLISSGTDDIWLPACLSESEWRVVFVPLSVATHPPLPCLR